jgi:hypothetical protein
MADNTNRKESNTPKWMKKLVRQRMERTGEKYTQALRAIKEEQKA